MSRPVLFVLVVLGLLFIGGRDREPDPVPAAAVPVAAEAAHPVPLEVPLSVSETTPPPDWNPPDTAEEQLALWLGDVGRSVLWQGGLAVVAILAVLGLMAAVEARRR